MKWPRKVFFLLLLALIGWLVVWLYPFVQPLLQHPPKSGWLTLIVHNLLTSKQNQDLIHSPMLWILLCIGGLMLLMMEIEMRTRRTDTHGSAHPATRSEIRPFVHITQRFPRVPRLPHVPLPRVGSSKHPAKRQRSVPEARLVLGTSRGKVISLSEEQQESNVFLVAPIGAGKTSLIVIRNILRERGTRSLLIPDVKGELVRVTAGAVAGHHEVRVFDPVHPDRSDGYNPLAYIHTIEDAQEYARCWVANTGKSPEEFWLDAARDLMAWTMMHLSAAEPQAPFGRIADILCGLTYPRLKSAFLTSPAQKVRELALPFFDYMDKNPKLIGSLMVDLSTRFQLLVSDHVRDITARNEIDFLAMTERPVALYLSIPRRYAERYQPLLACMVMQMFATWEEQADTSPTGRLPHQIMCYMDEFANLGYIPNMSGYITTARHTGVGILLAVQNYAQLDEKYGRAVRESILTNTKTHLLLPGGGLEETEYYSRRIGNTTVRTETHSVSGSGIEKRETWTQGETGRRLMTPDELRTMAADEMLMINATTAPMVLRTTPYYRDREVMHRANLPFPHVRVYQGSPTPPRTPPGSSTRQPEQQPTTALDGDQDNKQDNDQYFLQE
jgi:type IV secretion system protein VirD4